VVFYDWREYWNAGNGNGGRGKTIQAVQLDVARFNAWLENTNLDGTTNLNGGKYFNALCQSPTHKHHSIDSMYIYSSVAPANLVLPAVRIKNGQQLYDSKGLSVATPLPLYVQGDFNVTDGIGSNAGQNSTTHARPASFLADSITILSTAWNDGGPGAKRPNAADTTVNAACMAGIVPSDKGISATDNSTYSGGVENFFRLLENWSGDDFYYNGSIVVMFPSQYATNRWRKPGNNFYYDPPNRHWNFDTNFLIQDRLPPMAPQVKTVVRNSWANQ
ncbi:MAG TPA: hypothetical protein VN625_08245, partial [Desulfuromonadaceae bacterium]|nr:hypothetical protein [Desulfuromonadaceae bacterium]